MPEQIVHFAVRKGTIHVEAVVVLWYQVVGEKIDV